MSWDAEFDFVAVGSGAGAFSAAITAHDNGLSTVILEKAPQLGGVTALSLGEVWVPNNHVAPRDLGEQDSREEGLRYLQFLSAGFADPELQETLVDGLADVCRYLEEMAGFRWRAVKDMPDYYYGMADGCCKQGRMLDVEPFPGADLGEWQQRVRTSPHAPTGITHDELYAWGGITSMRNWDFEMLGRRVMSDMRTFGPGLAAYLAKAALVDRGVEAHVDARVDRLIVDSGRVVGVEAAIGGVTKTFGARRGVLLATGGYDWNKRLANHFEQSPDWVTGVLPSVEGDHLVMAGELGAEIAYVSSVNFANIYGYQVPGEELDGKPMWRYAFEYGLPFSVVVNRDGKRIADESFYRDYQPKVRQLDGNTQSYPNTRMYLIFDQNFRERYPIGTTPPGEQLPPGFAAQADDLATLAKELGIDAEGLTATMAKFNADAATGVDTEHGRGAKLWSNIMWGDSEASENPNFAAVERAPFYGVEMRIVSSGCNAAGLRFDKHARVLNVRGNPIAGLYVAGNSAAYLDVGAGYQSGVANGRGLAWGRIAALHAAGVTA